MLTSKKSDKFDSGLCRTMLTMMAIAFISLAAGLISASGYQPREVRRAVRDVAARADADDPEALYQLARLTLYGYDSIPADSLRALELYRRSAILGNPKARNYLGWHLIRNSADSASRAEGLRWLEKSANAGDATAMANIGYLLSDSTLFSPDYPRARYWLQKADSAGEPAAKVMLADIILTGRSLPADTIEAVKLYYQAVEAGIPAAAEKLAALEATSWPQLPRANQLRKALFFYNHRAPAVAIPLLRRLAEVDDKGHPLTKLRNDSCSAAKPDSNSAAMSDSNPDEKSISNPDTIRGAALALLGDAYARNRGVDYSHALSTRMFFNAAMAGNPAAAFILAETLEIFPDALIDILQDSSHPSAPAVIATESGSDPIDLADPAFWREQAAAAGIDTAEAATARLFNPLP